MKIEAIMIENQGGDTRTDAVVRIGDQLVLQVIGVGTPEGRWKVSAQRGDPGTFDKETVDATLVGLFDHPPEGNDGYRSMSVLGPWSVYMEPKTLAHALWDVLRNA